jgi:hypothetical protein
VKKFKSVNFVLIAVAICMFVNTLGIQILANIPITEKSYSKTELKTSDEYKSIKSFSYFGSEESLIEIENVDDADDDDDDSSPLFVFSFKPYEIREYQRYSQNQKNYSNCLKKAYLPLYIEYSNYRL